MKEIDNPIALSKSFEQAQKGKSKWPINNMKRYSASLVIRKCELNPNDNIIPLPVRQNQNIQKITQK